MHFLVLGLALFAIDRVRNPASAQRTLVVDAARVKQLTEDWTLIHGSPPSQDDQRRMIDSWIDDEILYREGLERGFDREDDAVRNRVVAKMAFVVASTALSVQPGPGELRAWFDANPQKWVNPAQVDFTHVFVEGDGATVRAHQLLAQLEGGADPSGLGDRFPGGRRYRDRQLPDLKEAFGDEFSTALADAKVGVWVLTRSKFGLHLVRVDGKTGSTAPKFEEIELDVRADWESSRKDESAKRELARLKQRWTVTR